MQLLVLVVYILIIVYLYLDIAVANNVAITVVELVKLLKMLISRVTLKRLSASTVGFQPALPEDDQHTLAVNQFGQTVLEEEELTLHWQKKFFSQVSRTLMLQ